MDSDATGCRRGRTDLRRPQVGRPALGRRSRLWRSARPISAGTLQPDHDQHGISTHDGHSPSVSTSTRSTPASSSSKATPTAVSALTSSSRNRSRFCMISDNQQSTQAHAAQSRARNRTSAPHRAKRMCYASREMRSAARNSATPFMARTRRRRMRRTLSS